MIRRWLKRLSFWLAHGSTVAPRLGICYQSRCGDTWEITHFIPGQRYPYHGEMRGPTPHYWIARHQCWGMDGYVLSLHKAHRDDLVKYLGPNAEPCNSLVTFSGPQGGGLG